MNNQPTDRPREAGSEEEHEDVRALQARLDDVQTEINILEHQADLLDEYSKGMTGKNADVTQFEAYLDLYGTRKAQIEKKKAELEKNVEKMDKELDSMRQALNVDEESIRRRGACIDVVVLAEGSGEGEMTLIYTVSNASWKPQYDLRATIAEDEKSLPSVQLHYRAAICQTTGEDWSDIRLSLSTATPMRNSDIPSLDPSYIIEEEPGVPRAHLAMKSARKTAVSATSMRERQAEVEEGILSSTFVIPGLSKIPSESNNEEKTHTVSIANLHFDSVELEWITVPREQPSAFLRCKVKNTSDYALLYGKSSVFLNGSFVTKSYIYVSHVVLLHIYLESYSPKGVSPKETFRCSLGIDPAVRVSYHPLSKKKRRTGSLLNAKTNVTSFEQVITVKNARISRIRCLRICEKIPLSEPEKIKVNLIEPNGLATTRGKVALRDGMQARWVKPGEVVSDDVEDQSIAEETDMNSSRGLFEWICEVGPSKTIDVTLAWEVIAPIDVRWIEDEEY